MWDAFSTLSNSRRWLSGVSGSSPLPITYSELAVYADWNGISRGEEFEWIRILIEAMDREFIDFVNKKSQKA